MHTFGKKSIIPNLHHALNKETTNEWTYESHMQQIQQANKQRNQYNSKALKSCTGWPCYSPIRQCPFDHITIESMKMHIIEYRLREL